MSVQKITTNSATENMTYEEKSIFAAHIKFTSPIAAELISIVAANNLTNKVQTIAAQPDYPRNLVVTIVDTTPSLTAGVVTVVGVDAAGKAASEVFTCIAAGTYTGNVAFATITSITTTGFTVLGGSGDETISVGVGLKFGFPVRDSLIDVYKAAIDNANTILPTVSTTYKTAIMNHAPDATHSYQLWYTYRSTEA